MAGISIKNVPDELHRRLKERARRNRRSMTQEILAILESELPDGDETPLAPLRKGRFPISENWLKRVKRKGLA
jgi:plasmid stability protein